MDNKKAIELDAISRQAVLEQTYKWCKDEFLRTSLPFDYLRKKILSLPSVSTEKTGRWEKHSYFKDAYICSVCNTGGNMVYKDFKYCPNCGAKMQEVEE